MAARGTRNMDSVEESFDDQKIVAQLRSKARKINRRALLTASVITLLALAFP